jgi:hypothetical protein
MAQRQYGSRVKVTGGMREFVGKTGTVVGVEQDGRTTMYRVRMDEPVEVPGVGRVTDDVWAASHVKTAR